MWQVEHPIMGRVYTRRWSVAVNYAVHWFAAIGYKARVSKVRG